MRTQAAGSFHENYCFMGQFHKFMTIQPIFDATDEKRLKKLQAASAEQIALLQRERGQGQLEG
jgi:hypothetical protein